MANTASLGSTLARSCQADPVRRGRRRAARRCGTDHRQPTHGGGPSARPARRAPAARRHRLGRRIRRRQGPHPRGPRLERVQQFAGLAAGVLDAHPEARTIVQVGGQSSLVVRLEDGLRRPWQVNTNPLCAAGTGRFLEQQAGRLGISLDDFAVLASQCEGRPRASPPLQRFAKSDLIHLQQKGVPVSSMLYALCESIARMVASLSRDPSPNPSTWPRPGSQRGFRQGAGRGALGPQRAPAAGGRL